MAEAVEKPDWHYEIEEQIYPILEEVGLAFGSNYDDVWWADIGLKILELNRLLELIGKSTTGLKADPAFYNGWRIDSSSKPVLKSPACEGSDRPSGKIFGTHSSCSICGKWTKVTKYGLLRKHGYKYGRVNF